MFLLTLLGAVNEIYLIISTFVIAFSTDTFAYIIGMLIGKNKLIPRISPNKSVEGAIGGTLFSLIITIIYFYFIDKYYVKINLNITVAMFIIFASVAGQFGDLFASKIKRNVQIKDYANLLPGHGGILDRFDSILFVSPLVYILFYYIS